MSRGIKVKVKCTLCQRWKFHTFFNEQARGFVCRFCGEWLSKNPHFKNMPFKGWGTYPPKNSGLPTDGPAWRKNG